MKNHFYSLICGLFAALIFGFLAESALAQDPTIVDSAHYKVEFENEQVRVVRITYGPGEKSVMHEHPDGVLVAGPRRVRGLRCAWARATSDASAGGVRIAAPTRRAARRSTATAAGAHRSRER